MKVHAVEGEDPTNHNGHEESKKPKNIESLMADNSHLHLHESVIELSILIFLKSAVRDNHIT